MNIFLTMCFGWNSEPDVGIYHQILLCRSICSIICKHTICCAETLSKATYYIIDRLKENTISKLTHKVMELGGVVHLVRNCTHLFFLHSQSRYSINFVAVVIDQTVILAVLNIPLLVFPGWRQLGEFTCFITLCNGSYLQPSWKCRVAYSWGMCMPMENGPFLSYLLKKGKISMYFLRKLI